MKNYINYQQRHLGEYLYFGDLSSISVLESKILGTNTIFSDAKYCTFGTSLFLK